MKIRSQVSYGITTKRLFDFIFVHLCLFDGNNLWTQLDRDVLGSVLLI